MKNYNLMLCSLLVIFANQLRAQGNQSLLGGGVDIVDRIGAMNGQTNSNVFAKKYNTLYDNTPYLPTQNMVSGYFIQANGKRFEIGKMTYNAYEKRIEYVEGENFYFPKEQIIEFGFTTGEVFQRNFQPMDDHNELTYFEVLNNTKTRLLMHTRAALLDVAAYSSADKIKHFDFTNTYFVLKNDGTFAKSRRLNDSLLGILLDKKAQIEVFIKENKLKCKTAGDFKKLLAYYDSI